jgi:glycosyltransferase involved in cell wall biosynthesis
MKKIIGVVGSGMIGSDPWDARCWSRSGFNLFTNLKQNGLLDKAVGVEVPMYKRAPVMLRNFAPVRRRWRQKFNLDPSYYRMLTSEIAKAARAHLFDPENAILQIGGHYNSAEATGLKSYSYHDGNVAGLMQSPYFAKDLLKHAKKAFAYEKRTYESMQKILVMSEYWRKSFIENFEVPPEKVINVGFGVNIDIPERLQKDHTTKNIIFVGIDFARKGGDSLVKAFNEVISHPSHKSAQLHIVGPKIIPDILKSSEYAKNIHYHGYLSRENPEEKNKLERVLASGNIFVLPSLYEPFGNAGLEAMLYGMPVIAPNNWSFPDFVIPGKTGALLEDSDNPEEIAHAIIKLLNSPETLIEQGSNGYDLVVEKYSWQNTVKNIATAMQVPLSTQ